MTESNGCVSKLRCCIFELAYPNRFKIDPVLAELRKESVALLQVSLSH